MMPETAAKRLLRDERGFTLTEMMVTIMIMLVVMFALYSIFDMSIRVFSFGNNKVEAAQNARLGLEKMEREIRGAYKVNATVAPAQNHVFFDTFAPATGVVPGAAQITFGNDLNGNRAIECPAGACEYITYKLTDDTNAAAACTVAPCTLRRANTATGSAASSGGDSVVENLIPGGLAFSYFEGPEDPLDVGDPEANITRVRVKLQVEVASGTRDEGAQTLTTDMDLRNRS